MTAGPASRPDGATVCRLLGWMARRVGPQFVLPTLIDRERADAGAYLPQSEASGLPVQERSHAHVLTTILGSTRAGLEGSALARLEGLHRAAGATRSAPRGSAPTTACSPT